jgi:hypothetical protein
MNAETELERLAWVSGCELKLASEGASEGEIDGYGSIFGELDQGNDIVMPGAFAKTLKDRDVQHIPFFFGHAHGSVPIGFLKELREDRKGLRYKGQLIFETPEPRQVRALLKAGASMGTSIGYKTVRRAYRTPDGKEHDEWQPGAVRLLHEVELAELSLTAMPMCRGARVTGIKEGLQPALSPADAELIRVLGRHTQDLHLIAALQRAAATLKGSS